MICFSISVLLPPFSPFCFTWLRLFIIYTIFLSHVLLSIPYFFLMFLSNFISGVVHFPLCILCVYYSEFTGVLDGFYRY